MTPRILCTAWLFAAALTPACGGTASDHDTVTSGDECAAASAYAADAFLPTQGERAFAVYVATFAPGDDAARAAVRERLGALGVDAVGEGELGCDLGAAEALGRRPDELAVAVYFRTHEDAVGFAEELGHTLGVADVSVRCAD